MIRSGLCCFLVVVALTVLGCNKSSEPQRAETAAGGLMPAEEPGFQVTYVTDQKDVKSAAPRQVSYESLDSFRAAAASKAKEKEAAKEVGPKTERAAQGSADEGTAVAEKAAGEKTPTGKKSDLIKRMKQATLGKLGVTVPATPGGGPAKPAGKPAEAKPAPEQEEKEEAKEEESGDE